MFSVSGFLVAANLVLPGFALGDFLCLGPY